MYKQTDRQIADTLFLLVKRTWNTLRMCESVDGQG